MRGARRLPAVLVCILAVALGALLPAFASADEIKPDVTLYVIENCTVCGSDHVGDWERIDLRELLGLGEDEEPESLIIKNSGPSSVDAAESDGDLRIEGLAPGKAQIVVDADNAVSGPRTLNVEVLKISDPDELPENYVLEDAYGYYMVFADPDGNPTLERPAGILWYLYIFDESFREGMTTCGSWVEPGTKYTFTDESVRAFTGWEHDGEPVDMESIPDISEFEFFHSTFGVMGTLGGDAEHRLVHGYRYVLDATWDPELVYEPEPEPEPEPSPEPKPEPSPDPDPDDIVIESENGASARPNFSDDAAYNPKDWKDVTLSVTTLEDDKSVTNAMKAYVDVLAKSATYDISLLSGDSSVFAVPDGTTMIVTLPIPEGMGTSGVGVFRVSGDGTVADMGAAVDARAGTVTFETGHFSTFAVARVGESMHRLYNRWTGEHFYTASDEEFGALVGLGWTDEGEGWVAPASGAPVYRLYNPYVEGGDHHYTMDRAEYDALEDAGWVQEGVGWFSPAEGEPGVEPLWRQYNPYATTGTHNYTTNKNENDTLVGRPRLGGGCALGGHSGGARAVTPAPFVRLSRP